jgi:hypothetical protein
VQAARLTAADVGYVAPADGAIAARAAYDRGEGQISAGFSIVCLPNAGSCSCAMIRFARRRRGRFARVIAIILNIFTSLF